MIDCYAGITFLITTSNNILRYCSCYFRTDISVDKKEYMRSVF
ncbi:hypothetical protein SAMN04487934_10771 [Eubacterium ruminantium]|nr:hypothetical protein SAMN04487934_10771 [Eubacterium ruminantium]